MVDPLIEVRTALTTTTNNDYAGSTTLGGAEIQKLIDKMIVDNINRDVDLRPLISRKPLSQLAFIWDIRTDLGSTSKTTFYDDGGSGTPYPSSKAQLYAVAKSLRSDYEVTGLMEAASASFYAAIADEAKDAIDDLKLAEEKSMISGYDTDAYGITGSTSANCYMGLAQLMRWHSTNGGDTEGTAANKMEDTGTVYGKTRAASGVDYMDVSYVLAGTIGTSTGVLELKYMDAMITKSNKKGAKGHNRIYFCSEERSDEINRLLQPQQSFTGAGGFLELEGGFRIRTYNRIPIVASRFMDKSGATNTGSWDSSTDADNSMYLLDLNYVEVRVLNGVDARHTPIAGQGDSTNYEARADARGGYFKTYATMVMKRFCTHVHLANLTAPTSTT